MHTTKFSSRRPPVEATDSLPMRVHTRLSRLTMKILVVDDTLTALTVVCHQVQRLGFVPIAAQDGHKALKLFASEKPDLVLLDLVMPEMDGFEVARLIRAMEKNGEWTPIIFLTSRGGDQDIQEGIEAGGDDYLVKPVSEVVLGAKVRAMQRLVQMRYSLVVLTKKLDDANRELQRISSMDGLTGVANRRSFDETLAREWRRAQRSGRPLSLLLGDVDFFKQFNDACGHQAGDTCLQAVAKALAKEIRRPGDMLARYGGEEFAAILPDTESAGANLLAEAMRRGVEALAIPHPTSSVSPVVTFSIGVATLTPGLGGDQKRLIGQADEALYDAKHGGRNRVVAHRHRGTSGSHDAADGFDFIHLRTV